METPAISQPIVRKTRPPFWVGLALIGSTPFLLVMSFTWACGGDGGGCWAPIIFAPSIAFVGLVGIGCLIASFISRFRPVKPATTVENDLKSPRRILVASILSILFIAGIIFTLLKAEFIWGVYGDIVYNQPFPAFDDSKSQKELQDRLDTQTAAYQKKNDQLTPDSEAYPSWIRTIPTPHGDLALSFNGKFAKLKGNLKSKCGNWVYDDTVKNTLNDVTFQFGFVSLAFCPDNAPQQDQWIEVTAPASRDTFYTIKIADDVVLSGDLHYGTLKYGQQSAQPIQFGTNKVITYDETKVVACVASYRSKQQQYNQELSRGEILVGFPDGIPADEGKTIIRSHSLTSRVPVSGFHFYLYADVPGGEEFRWACRLSQDTRIRYAEPNYIAQATLQP